MKSTLIEVPRAVSLGHAGMHVSAEEDQGKATNVLFFVGSQEVEV